MTDEKLASPFFRFRQQIYGPDGRLKHDDDWRNTVVTVGKNDVINQFFRGTSYTSIFYMGIKGTGAVAAGDTMASHAGWAETTAYSGTARSLLVFGAPTGGTSVCTPGTYAMTGTYTAAGAFITANGTAHGGTTGTLYSAGDIASTRTGGTGDTLVITPTVVIA